MRKLQAKHPQQSKHQIQISQKGDSEAGLWCLELQVFYSVLSDTQMLLGKIIPVFYFIFSINVLGY